MWNQMFQGRKGLSVSPADTQMRKVQKLVDPLFPFPSNKFTPNPVLGIYTKKRPLQDVAETWRGSISLALNEPHGPQELGSKPSSARGMSVLQRGNLGAEKAQAGPPEAGAE